MGWNSKKQSKKECTWRDPDFERVRKISISYRLLGVPSRGLITEEWKTFPNHFGDDDPPVLDFYCFVIDKGIYISTSYIIESVSLQDENGTTIMDIPNVHPKYRIRWTPYYKTKSSGLTKSGKSCVYIEKRWK